MEIDTTQIKKQTVSDDPELAKVLAGVNATATTTNDDNDDTELQYEGLEQLADNMPEVTEPEVAVEAPVAEEAVAAPAHPPGKGVTGNIRAHRQGAGCRAHHHLDLSSLPVAPG